MVESEDGEVMRINWDKIASWVLIAWTILAAFAIAHIIDSWPKARAESFDVGGQIALVDFDDDGSTERVFLRIVHTPGVPAAELRAAPRSDITVTVEAGGLSIIAGKFTRVHAWRTPRVLEFIRKDLESGAVLTTTRVMLFEADGVFKVLAPVGDTFMLKEVEPFVAALFVGAAGVAGAAR